MTRRIALYLGLCYAISWTVALVLYLAGVRYGSWTSTLLIATLYMPAPAFAALIVQRIGGKGPLASLGLTVRGLAPRYLLLGYLSLWLLVLGAFGLIGLAGNLWHVPGFGRVDFSAASLVEQTRLYLSQRGIGGADAAVQPPPFPAGLMFILVLVSGSLSGSVFNFPFALGEELGWRGFLLRETQAWGFARSSLFTGLVWGFWHAPLILQGHNYPGHPVSGVAAMTLFTTALTPVLGWLRLRARTVVAPTLFHGGLNAVGILPALFVVGADPLAGSIAGLAGILVLLVIDGVVLVADPAFAREYPRL